MAQCLIKYGTTLSCCDITLKYNLSVKQMNPIEIILNKPKSYLRRKLFESFGILDIDKSYKKQVVCFVCDLFSPKKF